MGWHRRWLDKAMQDPATDSDRAARSARLALGMSMWVTIALMGLFLVVSLLRWFVFDDDSDRFDLFGLIAFTFAIQAFALVGRETYHRKLLEERVKALEQSAKS